MQQIKKVIIVAIIFLVIIGVFWYFNNEQKNDFYKIQIAEDLGENIYQTGLELDSEQVYNIENQDEIENEINSNFTKKYKLENPLIIYNPYGTNLLSINAYFYTDTKTEISYVIEANDTKYEKAVYSENQYDIKHECQINGLVQGTENKVIIKAIDKKVNEQTNEFIINVPEINCPEVTMKNTTDKAIDGLYAILGMGDGTGNSDNVYMVDNTGIIRTIIPGKKMPYSEYNSTIDDIYIYDEYMYYNYDRNKIVKVNKLGKIVEIYEWDIGFTKHHDFVVDNKKQKLLILGSDVNVPTIDDIILIYDMNQKKLEKIINLRLLLNDIYERNIEKDWAHINTIDIKDEEVIINSRNLSSIISISDIYEEEKVDYIIGPKQLYEGTEFESKVYTKKGDFIDCLGEHTAKFCSKNGEEYISIFNNNAKELGYFEKINTDSNRTNSYYYLYKIDKNEKTYELIEEKEIEYSSVMSSAQVLNDNIINFSYEASLVKEYDVDGNLANSMKINKRAYRIQKYTFENFWYKK